MALTLGASERIQLGHARETRRAALVFLVALIVRLVVATVFFGDGDTSNAISVMPVVAQHGNYIGIPYFPLVTNWLGLAGILDAHWIAWARQLDIHFTVIPVGLVPKLLPCLADSLLAPWFALNRRQSPRHRSLASWIYATCPLPLLVASVQGQWDSVWILFALSSIAVATMAAQSLRSRILAGTLFTLAVLVKPTPILLLPLLLRRFRERISNPAWLRDASPVVLACLATGIAFFSWFALEGYSLGNIIHFILKYGATGSANVPFGLSQLNHLGSATGLLRDLAIVFAIAILVRYHLTATQKDPMATAAAVLLILPAVGGIAPQYLLWPLPFMLAAGRIKLSIIYSTISAMFVVAYFTIHREDLFFLPLRWLKDLAIPDSAKPWLYSGTLPDMWRRISDLAVPVFLIAIAVVLLRPGAANDRGALRTDTTILIRRALQLCVVPAIILVIATVAYNLGPYPPVATTLDSHLHLQLFQYALSIRDFNHGRTFVLSGSWWFSAIVVVPLLTVAWLLVALRANRRLGNVTDPHTVPPGREGSDQMR